MSIHNKVMQPSVNCPCGNHKSYMQCCEPLHKSAPASSAEALMRSRYSAFALHLPEYIQRSWHASTRPAASRTENSGTDQTRWLGLQIKRHDQSGDDYAVVEFVARYKIAGRAFVLHEVSRFVREQGFWFYLDGEILDR